MENGDRSKSCQQGFQPMGLLQSGIPLPSLVPRGWPLIVIDLKDCFFIIHLEEKDGEKFVFIVPT